MKKLIKTEAHVKQKLIKPWYSAARGWTFMPVSNGMGVGGIMDHIGCIPVTITPEMVGKTIGLSVNIEAKSPKKAGTASQRQFDQITDHRAAGGVSLVVGNEGDLHYLEDLLRRLIYESNSPLVYPDINIDKSRK